MADPFSWARTPAELSDGQRSRAELAYMLTRSGTIVIDEWLAKLDRLTAQAVAWATGQRLRRAGKQAILITSHDDLTEYLQPDLEVRVGWDPEPEMIGMGWDEQASCPILHEITHHHGERSDWHQLKHLHYAAGDPATFAEIYTARHPALKHPAAVAVMSYPDLHSSARNLATQDGWKIDGNAEKARSLNLHWRRLSRIVVAPELRALGLAAGLIEYCCAQTPADWLECTTAMGKYTNFLERAGFREYPQTIQGTEAELQDWAARTAVPPTVALDPAELPELINRLSVRKQREARKVVWNYFHQMALHRRTRRSRPKRIADANDPRWPEAFDLAARRLADRPTYWLRKTKPETLQ